MTAIYEDAETVRAAVASVPHHIDTKRWDALRALFAPEVRTDYTSLFGGSPQAQARDALVEGWRGLLGKVATQHLLGPVTVDVAGTGARAACHVRALHHAAPAPGGPLWEVLGHYEFELVRVGPAWQISSLTLRVLVQTGNARLLEEAQRT